MKNETICECGHPQERHACSGKSTLHHNDAWCEVGECNCGEFTAAKPLRDRLVEDCDGFNLSDGYCIEAISRGDWDGELVDWDVSGGGELVRGGFDTPEAAFAWLKDHLKEQK